VTVAPELVQPATVCVAVTVTVCDVGARAAFRATNPQLTENAVPDVEVPDEGVVPAGAPEIDQLIVAPPTPVKVKKWLRT
jgi:hypothetical protein